MSDDARTTTRPDGCAVCGAPTRAGRATPVELTHPSGLVTSRLQGVAAWLCERGHVELADPDLAARLGAATDAQLVVARRRRLRRDDACGACGEPLTLPGRTTETPVVDDTGPSVVTLSPTMGMVRCPGCGLEQVPHDVARALRDLLTHVVEAAAAPRAP